MRGGGVGHAVRALEMGGTAEQAELIRQFARDRGVSERTARNYRAAGHPEWVAWNRARALPAGGVVPTGGAVSDLDRAQAAADAAWNLLSRLQAAAAVERDPSALAEQSAAIERARRNWESARKDLRSIREQLGHLVPVENVRLIQQTAIARLAAIWRAWPNKVAGDLLPDARPAFFTACRKNAADWDAALHALDEELEKLIVC